MSRIGNLKLQIIDGYDIKRGNDKVKASPYCKVRLGNQKHKTTVASQTSDPLWDESFTFTVADLFEFLEIEVHDSHKDELLGTISIQIDDIAKKDSLDEWFKLEVKNKSKEPSGSQAKIHLRLKYMTSATEKVRNQSEFFYVEVLGARELLANDTGACDAYCKLKFGDQKHKTSVIKDTTSPTWDDKTKFKLGPKELVITVLDDHKGKETVLGVHRVEVRGVKGQGVVDKWFPLQKKSKKSPVSGKIHLVIGVATPKKWETMTMGSNTAQKPVLKESLHIGSFGIEVDENSAREKKQRRSRRAPSARSLSSRSMGSDSLEGSESSRKKKHKKSQFMGALKHTDKMLGLAMTHPKGKLYISVIKGHFWYGDAEGVNRDEEPLMDAKPFCIIDCQRQLVQTELAVGPKPKWNDECLFNIDKELSDCKIEVYNQSEQKENYMGTLKVSLKDLKDTYKMSGEYSLKHKSKSPKSMHGKINLSFRFEPFETEHGNTSDSSSATSITDGAPIAKLTVRVIEGRALLPKDKDGSLSPLVHLKLEGSKVKTDSSESTNPSWQQKFVLDVRDMSSVLHVTVWDKYDGMFAKNDFMGAFDIPLSDLEDERAFTSWYTLHPRSDRSKDRNLGEIRMKLSLVSFDNETRSTSSRGSRGSSKRPKSRRGSTRSRRNSSRSHRSSSSSDRGDKSSRSKRQRRLGKAHVEVVSANGLVAKKGSPSPYIECSFEAQERKSSVVQFNSSPEWNTTFDFNVYDGQEEGQLEFAIWDFNTPSKPDFLGGLTISMSELITEGHIEGAEYTLSARSRKDDVSGTLLLNLTFQANAPVTPRSIIEVEEPEPQYKFVAANEVDKDDKPDVLLRVVLIGDSAVGKTSLFKRYMNGAYDDQPEATINVDVDYKTFKLEGKVVKVKLWDTAGQERFQSMARQYYRGAHGAIVVYDVTRRNTFLKLRRWIEDVHTFSGNPYIITLMIGNKSDLSNVREVSIREAENFAKENGINYLETSAKTSSNVQRAFDTILGDIFSLTKTSGFSTTNDLNGNDDVDLGVDVVLEQPNPPGKCSC